jgi:hypothetical protein
VSVRDKDEAERISHRHTRTNIEAGKAKIYRLYVSQNFRFKAYIFQIWDYRCLKKSSNAIFRSFRIILNNRPFGTS